MGFAVAPRADRAGQPGFAYSFHRASTIAKVIRSRRDQACCPDGTRRGVRHTEGGQGRMKDRCIYRAVAHVALAGCLFASGCGSDVATHSGALTESGYEVTRLRPLGHDASLLPLPDRTTGHQHLVPTQYTGEFDPLPGIGEFDPLPAPIAPRRVARDVAPSLPSPAPAPAPAMDIVAEEYAPRSTEMIVVAKRAHEHVERGFNLAGRGAVMSARSEFLMAVRMIAEALDVFQSTDRHTQALAAGVRALDEAEDFVPRGNRFDADFNVAFMVENHRTPVLHGNDAESISPIVAMQQYYTYAQEQLGVAAGSEAVGSLALYGLGKLHGVLAAQNSELVADPEAKAMVYYHAALVTDPQNYMAANELAVWLARYGRYEPARSLLLASLSVAPQPATWHNLSVVHEQLGESGLAELAGREALALMGQGPGSDPGSAPTSMGRFDVEWMHHEAFAQSSKPSTELRTSAVEGQTEETNRFKTPQPTVRSWFPFTTKH